MGPKFLCRLTLLQTHFMTINSLNWLKTFTPAYFTGDFFQGHIDEGWPITLETFMGKLTCPICRNGCSVQ